MPELPEVETIRRGLEKHLVGGEIVEVEVRLVRLFEGESGLVVGSRISGVRRFGKGLVIDFENGYSLAIHVKMTGQLVVGGWPMVVGKNEYPNKWTHVIFKIKRQKSKTNKSFFYLYYSDIRQFGWMKVVRTDDVGRLSFFMSLGLEPAVTNVMVDKPFLTLEKFAHILKKTRMPIKNLLMDQRRIAGVGNIYANDCLYLAGVHPGRAASSLSREEAGRVFDSLEEVLKKGLEVGGASEWNYVNVLGEAGGYQNFFKVYRRDGDICGRCGGIIKRVRMGGRGTFFCAGCQR